MTRNLPSGEGRRRTRGEQGSALVLALLFLTVCGITIGGLLTFANTSSNATTALRLTRYTDFDAHAAVQVAIANVRVGTLSCSTSLPVVLPLNNLTAPVRVDCYQLSTTSGSHAKRNDVFLVCPASVNPPCDTNPSVPLLRANVTFYDTPVLGFSVGIQSWSSR